MNNDAATTDQLTDLEREIMENGETAAESRMWDTVDFD